MSKAQETMQELARLTLLSNKLSDVQLKNLQMYAFVFFDGVKELKLDYDLSNNMEVESEEDAKNIDVTYKFHPKSDHLRVSYYLTVTPGTEQPNIERRFASLESSVRHILWKDIKVQLFINDKMILESKK